MSMPELTKPSEPCRATPLSLAIEHVLARIDETRVGEIPFWHCFVERVLPDWLYDDLRALMLEKKYGSQTQERRQDSALFVNTRFNLVGSEDEAVVLFRAIFEDERVKERLFALFYVDPQTVANACVIHKEFEFFFTKADRFQNIHVDIPPKCLSFVFYLPETEVDPEMAQRNATVLYDEELEPHYRASFKPNSVCVFAPHFSSYHGFSSTIDRDVLVMFYVDNELMQEWREVRRTTGDVSPFDGVRDAIHRKLTLYPQKAFPTVAALEDQRRACLVNAPDGRVMRAGAD